MPEAPLLTAEERLVDVCVLGTGLTESLAAAAVARQGKRVLHLDRARAYGGNVRALNLVDLEAWVDESGVSEADVAEPRPRDEDISGLTVVRLASEEPRSCFPCRSAKWDPYGLRSGEELQELKEKLRKVSNSFSIDVIPRLLFGRSDLVDVLVESGVARYLEFQGLKSARVLTSQGLVSVPLTKSDIFQDPNLTLPEKRMLMRFITSMSPFVGSLAFESPAQLGVDQARKVPAPSESASCNLEGVNLDQPWSDFLQQQKLSLRLQELLTYAICLWDWALPGSSAASREPEDLSTGEGLRCLGRFVSSLGVHGRGTSMPLLYPMYGVAELAQGFTRMCALHRGTYALRTYITEVLAKQDGAEDDGRGDWHIAGVVTHRGEVIRARSVITSCDHLLQSPSQPPAVADSVDVAATQSEGHNKSAACKRMTVLVDCPLLGEEGLNMCVVPPRAMDPALANVVQVLQLDWSTGTCPKGHHVVHLSQAMRASEVKEEDPNLFNDLEVVLLALLSHAGGQAHCLLRCTYLQQPRDSRRWDTTTPEGKILEGCSSGHSLMVCSDPAAVPQLLAGAEVVEARNVFLQVPLYGAEAPASSDFLAKPVHVAQEEQSSSMEALEHFNEQMLSSEQVSASIPQSAISPDEEQGAPAAPAPDAAGAESAAGAPAAADPGDPGLSSRPADGEEGTAAVAS